MVRISKSIISVEGGLHRIVVDTNNEIPKIEIELGAGMTDQEYLVWNLANAIRTINNKPQEKNITLTVYKIHREVLRNRGVSEEKLAESDEIFKKYTGVVV